ncbi:MAG: hypothetical protein GF341_04770 [candidate division Zixibacteria bacterium]|nr:hypothetical protein [candidate division Zixibacteria bacterium]
MERIIFEWAPGHLEWIGGVCVLLAGVIYLYASGRGGKVSAWVKRMWTGLPVVLLACVLGCNQPYKATTVVEIDPVKKRVYYQNDKDMALLLEGLEADASQKTVKLDRLELSNSASTVMAAYVEQMKQYNEEFRIHGQNIVNGLKTALGPLTVLTSLFTGIPPSGAYAPPDTAVAQPVPRSATGSNPLLEMIADRVADRLGDRLPQPTTQPVE